MDNEFYQRTSREFIVSVRGRVSPSSSSFFLLSFFLLSFFSPFIFLSLLFFFLSFPSLLARLSVCLFQFNFRLSFLFGFHFSSFFPFTYLFFANSLCIFQRVYLFFFYFLVYHLFLFSLLFAWYFSRIASYRSCAQFQVFLTPNFLPSSCPSVSFLALSHYSPPSSPFPSSSSSPPPLQSPNPPFPLPTPHHVKQHTISSHPTTNIESLIPWPRGALTSPPSLPHPCQHGVQATTGCLPLSGEPHTLKSEVKLHTYLPPAEAYILAFKLHTHTPTYIHIHTYIHPHAYSRPPPPKLTAGSRLSHVCWMYYWHDDCKAPAVWLTRPCTWRLQPNHWNQTRGMNGHTRISRWKNPRPFNKPDVNASLPGGVWRRRRVTVTEASRRQGYGRKTFFFSQE